MRTFYIVCFFSSLFPCFIFAQNNSVIGTINDAKNDAIAFANVILKDSTNTKIIKGKISDENGLFEFKNLQATNYYLQISYLGFKTFVKLISINGRLDLKTIILKNETEYLDGVVVTAKRPTIQRLVDRLIFNVENSTLSNSNTLDVLKQTPGVIVQDGKITVKQSTPVVYINGRRIYLSIEEVQQLLESTPANNLKSIEVITNPPAKYDAEGGAVLNIILSKNVLAGYHGSVFGNYQQGFQFPKFSTGTSHFFKSKKFNAYINYTISPKKDFRNILETINFIQESSIVSSWETDFDQEKESDNQNITASINYEFDDKNSLNFSAITLIAPRDNSKTRVNSFTEVFNANKVLDSSFRTVNNIVSEKMNLAFSLAYSHKFQKEGELISLDIHHTNYEFSEFQNVDTGYFLPNASSAFRDNRFQTFSNQQIQLFTGQVDYKLPTKNDAIFETGVKFSNINSDNILDQFSFNQGERNINFENSNVFNYDEKIYAAYTSYKTDWSTWSLQAGLRFEATETLSSLETDNANNINNYLNLFPSFYLLKNLNNNDQIYLNYSRRIHRPRYRKLNPFRYFLNDNSFRTGDPNLLPQIDNEIIIGYNFNKIHTFELYLSHEKNPTLQIVFQDNEENIIQYINTNINMGLEYGFDYSSYIDISDNWSLYILHSLFIYENQFFALESNGELLTNRRLSNYLNVSTNISILKDKSLSVSVNSLYISSLVDGPSIYSDRFGLDIFIKKLFFNSRATLSLGVNDVFNSLNLSQRTNYLNQDISSKFNIENRLFNLGFTYKFGNFKLKNTRKTINTEERERLK